MKFFGNTYKEAVTRAAEGARSLRALSIEGAAIEEGLGKGWGRDIKTGRQGRHTELDTTVYKNAAQIVKNSPEPLLVRAVMAKVGYKPDASGREKFLRSLFPHDASLFTSEDDEYIGYLGLHDEKIIAYDELPPEERRRTRLRRYKKKGEQSNDRGNDESSNKTIRDR